MKRRKSHIWGRALSAALLAALLLVLPLGNTASAWFYFPNPKSVSLETAPDVPFTLNVYALNSDGTVTACATETDVSGTTTIPVDLSLSFFRWGDEYFCETESTLYYVFEIIYDSDIFFTDVSRLPLESIISANMTYSALDETNAAYTISDGVYLRFPFYTVSYAIGADANITLGEGHTALHEAQNADYTELISEAAILATSPTGTNLSETMNGQKTDDLSELAAASYKQIVTVDGQSSSRLRLIYYVRVQADEELITNRLSALGDSGHTNLILQTSLTMTSEFHTVPAYTGD